MYSNAVLLAGCFLYKRGSLWSPVWKGTYNTVSCRSRVHLNPWLGLTGRDVWAINGLRNILPCYLQTQKGSFSSLSHQADRFLRNILNFWTKPVCCPGGYSSSESVSTESVRLTLHMWRSGSLCLRTPVIRRTSDLFLESCIRSFINLREESNISI